MVVELRLYTRGYGELTAWMKHLGKYAIPNMSKGITKESAKQVAKLARHNISSRSKYHGKNPGQLHDSIKVHSLKRGKSMSYSVVAETPYAGYVEAGTKAHFIPFGFGRISGVNHPGAKPMWFMRDALLTVLNRMDGIINTQFERNFRR